MTIRLGARQAELGQSGSALLAVVSQSRAKTRDKRHRQTNSSHRKTAAKRLKNSAQSMQMRARYPRRVLLRRLQAIHPTNFAPASAKTGRSQRGLDKNRRATAKSHAAALMSDTPATCTLLLGLFAFFAVIRVKRWTGDTVGASAESIEGRQYWRLLTSNCAHIDATRRTSYSIYPQRIRWGALERRHGSAALLWSTSALVVFVGLVAAALTRHGGGAVGAWHLGFSGVLFAWITWDGLALILARSSAPSPTGASRRYAGDRSPLTPGRSSTPSDSSSSRRCCPSPSRWRATSPA